MYTAAQQNGVGVFLDGLDGDTTVSHGFELLDDLAKRFRWLKLYREGSLLAQNLFQGSTARRILWRYCFRDMMPDWAHKAWRFAHGRFRELSGNSTLLSTEFEERLQLRKRVLALTSDASPKHAREHHLKSLNYSLYAHSLEMADKATASFGIEARYPFFDRRLVEFCLALPADQKLAEGWNRMVFRRAMQGILPHEIQWRCGKGNLSTNFHRKLLEFEGDRLNELTAPGNARIAPFVDMAALRYACDSFRAAPLGMGGKYSMQLFAAANLETWMRSTPLSRGVAAPQGEPHSVSQIQQKFTVQTP
jgi:asparagine synthase (glutamine-hydrolysing)